MQLTEEQLENVVKELQKNALIDARENLCKKYNFEYENINNVILIVPEKYMFNNPYKWIVFDGYVDKITIYENRPITF
jgi:hypothetical protein